MSGPPPSREQPDADSGEAGVLGNLPRSRPAVRSPRRGRAAAAARQPPEERQPEPLADASGPTELEALARAGVGLAGSAASVGLRLAARAASTVRGAIERR